MYALLTLMRCTVPGLDIDPQVSGRLQQKFGGKSSRIRNGDDSVFDELFSDSRFCDGPCPRLLNITDHNQFAKRQQSSRS